MRKKLHFLLGVLLMDVVLFSMDIIADFSVISVIGLVCTVFSFICICSSLKLHHKKNTENTPDSD